LASVCVARYARTFGAVSCPVAATRRSSTLSDFSVSVAAEAICASSLAVRATSTSNRSFCGNGNIPRAAARRAGCGALPLMMASTTGFVDVISAVKVDFVLSALCFGLCRTQQSTKHKAPSTTLGVNAVALLILLTGATRAGLVASDLRLISDDRLYFAFFL